jgi:peroxiredoxin
LDKYAFKGITMRISMIIKYLLCLLFLTTLFISCNQQSTASEYPLITNCDGKATIGEMAPNFSWIGKDNIRGNLTDFRGKPVIIFTWDIACNWCTDIMLIHLNNNLMRYTEKGIAIITINDGDGSPRMTEFLKDKNYHFVILRDEPSPEYKFRSPYLLKRGNPWIVFIDKKGVLVDKNGIFTNPSDATEKDLQNLIDKFISAQ